MDTKNIIIKANGSVRGIKEYCAERISGELLATISPRLDGDGSYSKQFLNVCTLDGKTEEVAGIEEARNVLAAKFFQ